MNWNQTNYVLKETTRMSNLEPVQYRHAALKKVV